MRRRRFLLASGTTILGSSTLGVIIQRPSLALNFDLVGIDDVQPSNIDSILLNFQNFELIPRYINENENNATISIRINIEDHTPVENTTTVQLQNGEPITNTELGDSTPIVLDEINTNKSGLDGQITVTVEHPSISDSYTQSFTISAYEPVQATGGDNTYKLVDQGESVITESQLGSNESLDDYNGTKYKVHVFTNTGSQNFNIDQHGDDGEVDVLIVGGGGGGGDGGGSAAAGAGGGAGGVISRTLKIEDQVYNIEVGSGGSGTYDGKGTSGENSTAFGLTAIGGGGGGGTWGDGTGKDGGSGGGGGGGGDGTRNSGGSALQPDSSSGGLGNSGGGGNPSGLGGEGDDVGGGGGGAKNKGEDAEDYGIAGNGGSGLDYSNSFGEIYGENGYFAGGGGGAVSDYVDDTDPGLGGNGGGGRGGDNGAGENAMENTGGGGGGGEGATGGDGASGIVLIRYPIEPTN